MATIDFKLPDIGEGVAEGEITSWKVKAGDVVTEDQIMVEVMTDKATVEIGSPVDGTIVELRAAEGETVPVGETIIVLQEGAGGDAAAPAASSKPAPAASTKPAPAASSKPAPAASSKPAAAAPAAAPEPVAAASAAGDGAGGSLEAINFALPDIGEGVAEGEVTRWMVKAGDAVTEDQPIVEVMTDKATVEIGSPVDGQVLEILHPEGAVVPVGDILLVLGAHSAAATAVGAQDAPEPAAEPATKATAPAPQAAPQPVAAGVATANLSDTGLSTSAGDRRVRAAPATRRLARELGVEVALLEGSGPRGRVTNDDVRRAQATGGAPVAAPAPAAAPAAAAPAPAAKAPRPATKPAARPAAAPARAAPAAAAAPAALEGDERIPLRGLRKRIASQMRLSKDTAAHFTYVEEIDVTELVKLRKAAKRKAQASGVNITYMPFLMKAIVPALREFPLLNASLDEQAGEVVLRKDINLGIAVDTDAGLIVPVVRAVDGKSLMQLSSEMAELADRARAGKTRPDDIGGGTFTITNAGNIGGMFATPIINVPEVAIIGVHAIRQRPWVVEGEIVVRDIMLLSLSLDHRVVDGAVGARFMNRVKELLESPALLLLEDI